MWNNNTHFLTLNKESAAKWAGALFHTVRENYTYGVSKMNKRMKMPKRFELRHAPHECS